MDLIFNRKYFPANELSDEVKERIGNFSRYIIHLKFKYDKIWDNFRYPFIFDTGAFISFAPEVLMEEFNIKPEFEWRLGGLHPDEKCKVTTKVGRATFKIIDDRGFESREIEAWFAFHPLAEYISLLGMKNIINDLDIYQNTTTETLTIRIE